MEKLENQIQRLTVFIRQFFNLKNGIRDETVTNTLAFKFYCEFLDELIDYLKRNFTVNNYGGLEEALENEFRGIMLKKYVNDDRHEEIYLETINERIDSHIDTLNKFIDELRVKQQLKRSPIPNKKDKDVNMDYIENENIILINDFVKRLEKKKETVVYSPYEDTRYDREYKKLTSDMQYFVKDKYGKEIYEKIFESAVGFFVGGDIDYNAELKDYKEHLETYIAELESLKFKEERLGKIFKPQITINKMVDTQINSKKIFIVHGHNLAMRESIARFLEGKAVKLEPIILDEQPYTEIQSIFEKFEKNSDVSVAIILYSADDKIKVGENEKLTARHNVIFEMGYFIGKLGKNRVIFIRDDNASIEQFSDIKGIEYISYDNKGAWKFNLGKALRTMNFEIDLNKI